MSQTSHVQTKRPPKLEVGDDGADATTVVVLVPTAMARVTRIVDPADADEAAAAAAAPMRKIIARRLGRRWAASSASWTGRRQCASTSTRGEALVTGQTRWVGGGGAGGETL